MKYLGRNGVAIVERCKDNNAGVATQWYDSNYSDCHDRNCSEENENKNVIK